MPLLDSVGHGEFLSLFLFRCSSRGGVTNVKFRDSSEFTIVALRDLITEGKLGMRRHQVHRAAPETSTGHSCAQYTLDRQRSRNQKVELRTAHSVVSLEAAVGSNHKLTHANGIVSATGVHEIENATILSNDVPRATKRYPVEPGKTVRRGLAEAGQA